MITEEKSKFRNILDKDLSFDSHMYFDYWDSSRDTLYLYPQSCEKYKRILNIWKRIYYDQSEREIRMMLDDKMIEFMNHKFPELKKYLVLVCHPQDTGFDEIKINDHTVIGYLRAMII